MIPQSLRLVVMLWGEFFLKIIFILVNLILLGETSPLMKQQGGKLWKGTVPYKNYNKNALWGKNDLITHSINS